MITGRLFLLMPSEPAFGDAKYPPINYGIGFEMSIFINNIIYSNMI